MANDKAENARVQPESRNVDLETTSQLPFVSVVIPVFNDLDGLVS